MVTCEITTYATKVETQLKVRVQIAFLEWRKPNKSQRLGRIAFEEIGGCKFIQNGNPQAIVGARRRTQALEARNSLICPTGSQQARNIFPLDIQVGLKVKESGIRFGSILIALVLEEPIGARRKSLQAVGINLQGLI